MRCRPRQRAPHPRVAQRVSPTGTPPQPAERRQGSESQREKKLRRTTDKRHKGIDAPIGALPNHAQAVLCVKGAVASRSSVLTPCAPCGPPRRDRHAKVSVRRGPVDGQRLSWVLGRLAARSLWREAPRPEKRSEARAARRPVRSKAVLTLTDALTAFKDRVAVVGMPTARRAGVYTGRSRPRRGRRRPHRLLVRTSTIVTISPPGRSRSGGTPRGTRCGWPRRTT